jgi:hypothetical protein
MFHVTSFVMRAAIASTLGACFGLVIVFVSSFT